VVLYDYSAQGGDLSKRCLVRASPVQRDVELEPRKDEGATRRLGCTNDDYGGGITPKLVDLKITTGTKGGVPWVLETSGRRLELEQVCMDCGWFRLRLMGSRVSGCRRRLQLVEILYSTQMRHAILR
jgi:hypothetical protein